MSREEVHNRIDELLGVISINNGRLSLHTEKLSQLDIDVLRKNCIELYEQINLLALKPENDEKIAQSPVSEPSQEVQKEVTKVEPESNNPPAADPVIEEPLKKVEEVEPKESSEPKSTEKPVKQVQGYLPDEEMQSLFERFSNKPIESIAKALSVAKRFEFQSGLFEGNADTFKTFLQELDTAADREGAFAVYHKYKMEYKWDNDELKDELKALMYRKYH